LVAFYNSAGFTHLIIDVFGFFTSGDAGVSTAGADGLGVLGPPAPLQP
jgi:hypothetical protein